MPNRLLVLTTLSLLLCFSPIPALADSSPQEQIQTWTNEIAKLIDRQQFAEALVLAKQSLELNQKSAGADDPSNCKHLNNVGWLYQQNGDYGEARKSFESAMSISESHKLQDNEYAWSLNNLATLLYLQGDFEASRPYYERSLAIYEKLNDWQKTVRSLRNLAGVLDALDKGEEALAAYKRAIEIVEKQPTIDQLELAQCLEGLGSSLEDKGKFEECLPLFKRCLEIKEKLLGPDHIELVSSLNNLAVLNMDTGHRADARPLLDRALAITEAAEGKAHIDLVVLLNNIGDLELLNKNSSEAEKNYLRAAGIVDTYLADLLPYCSVAEQYAVYKAYSREQLSRLLSVCRDPEKISEAYKIFFAWKGTLLSSIAKQSEARRLAKPPELKAKLEALAKTRSELAAWYQEAGSVPLKVWKDRNSLLTEAKEKLEREISAADPSIASSEAKPSLDIFQSLLKPDEAVIDIFQYQHLSPGEKGITQEPRYAAIITCGGTNKSQTYIDLPDARTLHFKLRQWRDEVMSLRMADSTWTELSSSLSKPYASLPPSITKVWICPDAELARLPWHLIKAPPVKSTIQGPPANSERLRTAGGSPAHVPPPNPSLLICQIDSLRELAKLKTPLPSPAPSDSSSMLLVGNIDFNAGMTKDSTQTLIHFPQLPGTAQESKSIADLAKTEHLALIELSGPAATKADLLKFLPTATYVHLATHGFFFNETFVEAARSYQQQNTRSVQLRPKLDANLSRRNPLVESGIALAGANKATSDKAQEKTGLLTAEEFIDTDMSKCRFAALSACDTGRGEELTGQGVMGLRASILAAGARNLLISLWKVPDIPTAELMKDFYNNLWTKKLPAAEALKQAQESLQKKLSPNAKQPINWAAWILVGEGW